MDTFNAIITAITTVGFPIVMCLIIHKDNKDLAAQHKAETDALTNSHKDEIKELSAVISEIKVALVSLTDHIKG